MYERQWRIRTRRNVPLRVDSVVRNATETVSASHARVSFMKLCPIMASVLRVLAHPSAPACRAEDRPGRRPPGVIEPKRRSGVVLADLQPPSGMDNDGLGGPDMHGPPGCVRHGSVVEEVGSACNRGTWRTRPTPDAREVPPARMTGRTEGSPCRETGPVHLAGDDGHG